jgi:hypothetical protein
MIVAGVVDAVAGEEVEDDASVFGVEFGSDAAAVPDVHAEETEETYPLGIDETTVGVRVFGGCRQFRCGGELLFGWHRVHLSMTLEVEHLLRCLWNFFEPWEMATTP